MLLQAIPECLLVRCALLFGLHDEPGELAGCGEPGGSRLEPHGRALAIGMDPFGDKRRCARKALVPNFAPQVRLIRTALGQTRLEVGDIRINFPRGPDSHWLTVCRDTP